MITNEFISYLLHGNNGSFAGLNRIPPDVWHPIAQSPYYNQTCFALKQIMDLRLDLRWGYELELGGAPNESAIIFKDYLPTRFRKLITSEIIDDFRKTLKQNNYICRITQQNESENMAKTKKPESAVTDLIKIPADEVIDVHYAATKQEVATKLDAVKKITAIETAEQAETAITTTKELSDLFKKVEDVRTTLKAPFLAAGKAIDARAKLVTAGVDDEISRVKKLLLDYQTLERQKAAEEAAAAEAARQKAEQAAANQTAQVLSAVDFLEQKCTEIYKKLSEVKTWEEIRQIFAADFSPDAWAKHAQAFAGFEIQAAQVRTKIVDYAKAVEACMIKIVEAPDNSEQKREAFLSKALANTTFEKEMFDFFSQLKGHAEQQVEQVEMATEIQKAQITSQVMNNTSAPVVSTRKTVGFELVSAADVIANDLQHLLVLNNVAVNEMLSDISKSGSGLSVREDIRNYLDKNPGKDVTFKGLRFFYNESVSL